MQSSACLLKMAVRSLGCAGAGIVLLLLSGCRTALPPVQGPPPQVAMTYYPYGPALARQLAAPYPNYDGWTEERMLRDLGRLDQLEFDLLLLGVDTSQLGQAFFQQRYEQFFAMLAARNSRFQVALWLYASAEQGTEVPAVVDWLVRTLATSAHYRRVESKALLVLAPEVSQQVTVVHPGLTVWRTAGPQAQLAWQLQNPEQLQPYGELAQVVICAGHYVAGQWRIERANGRTIHQQMVAALKIIPQPRLLGVASWNNFANGSFVEPSNLGDDRAFQELKRDLIQLKAERPAQTR